MVNGQYIEWDILKLEAFENRLFHINLLVDSTTSMGDFLCYSLRLDTFDMEIDTLNNMDSVCLPIVASYDPNNKIVYPSGNVTSLPKHLEYIINFQNLGSSFARNIVVTDTLSNQFEYESFSISGASHPYSVYFDGKVLKFIFKDINLDYANHDSDASKGWIGFSIKPKLGLKAGITIRNRASIFFDYNPAVITNYAEVTLVNGSRIETKQSNIAHLQIYPNPASTTLHITSSDLSPISIQIFNIHGALIESQRSENETKLDLDISNWPNGIYFIRSDKGIYKWIKM
ncbi:MAG: T9SS type A sorting domain-containing protein [Bacteroidia bacterium]